MNSSAAGFKNVLTILYILTGTVCLLSVKMQNIQWVDQGGIRKQFFHPFMQTFMMFVGQALCLFVYWIMKSRNRKFYSAEAEKALAEGRRPAPKEYILISAVSDLLASSLQYMSLNFMPASIYQILKGGSIVTTFLFSKWLIGGKTKKSEVSGCFLSLIGVTLVGLSAVLFNQDQTAFTTENIIVGSILMLVSLVISGFQFAYEGRLFKNYYIEPILMVGMEGLYGLVLSWCMSVGFMFIPCSFGQQACVYDKFGMPFIERPEQYFFETINSGILISMIIITVISIAMFNLTGLVIIKYINALAAALLNITKTALIWIIGIVVTLTAGKSNPAYQWEILAWRVLVMEAVGFAILIFATLIYNENIYIKGLSTEKDIYEGQEQKLMLMVEQQRISK